MPIPLILALAAAAQAGSTAWGAYNQNKTNKANKKTADKRQAGLEADIRPRLGGGPGEAEKYLLSLLTGDGEGGMPGLDSESFNTGQDALMQMLREDPYDTGDLFKSWEPIEQRGLDEALSGAFGQASGLGQRFGSSMMREEGRVRGQAAENSTARRQQMRMEVGENSSNRRLQAAGSLGQLGLGEMGQMLQMIMGLGSMEQTRGNQDTQLLSLLYGSPMAAEQPGAGPGALGDISQLLMLLPMLQGLMGGAKPGATTPRAAPRATVPMGP